jgi:hypothetical protein
MPFIRLDRKFFENVYWTQQRTFSPAEAWLDLIQLARFDAEPFSKLLTNGRYISIKRGELHAGLRFLSNRWQWGVEKTQRFINRHIKNNEIERRTEHGETILKLLKYEKYNPRADTDQYTDQDTDQYTGRTLGSTNNKKEENVENEKNVNSVACATDRPGSELKNEAGTQNTSPVEMRRKRFYSSLTSFVGTYKREMVRAFYNHWSELNKSGTKMRWELEKTWELPRRLATWAAREPVFNKTNNSTQPAETHIANIKPVNDDE